MDTGILYVSYDGMLEPLGQSQVIAYLERLKIGRRIHVLSFEKEADMKNATLRSGIAKRLEDAGIFWHPRTYHKRPSAIATAWDICVGLISATAIVLRHKIDIVHARSYVAGVMAFATKKLTNARLVFDMRGFWADERVEGELWPIGGAMFRVAKWFEKRLLLGSDHVVSLTNAGISEMRKFDYLGDLFPPYSVIPTCVDLERFKSSSSSKFRELTVGYVGSVGTWYMFAETALAIRILLDLRPDARILIVNRGEHEFIKHSLVKSGVLESQFELRTADHSEMPQLIAKMDASIFFIKPVFSKQASAPTKLGEFLASGVPCMSNFGVGDMAEILESENVGVAVDSFDEVTVESGVVKLLSLLDDPEISSRCEKVASTYFALDGGVNEYAAIYDRLGS